MHYQINNTFDFYNFLVGTNTRIPTNMFFFHSPGHWYIELDNLLRMIRLGELKGAGCVLVLPNRPQCHVMRRLYGRYFATVLVDDRFFGMAREISLQFPELTVDVGISNFKHQVADRTGHVVGSYHGTPVLGFGTDAVYRHHRAYYRRYGASRDYCPLADLPPLPDALADFLGPGRDRLALLQIKVRPGNATGVLTDIDSYLPTVAFLKDSGYTPVLIGREPMPDALRRFGVIDYAGSPFASFENDILLLRQGKFSIFSGSGLGFWGSVSGHPFLYANHWHLMWPPPAPLCVGVPAIVTEKATGRPLSFRRQIALIADPAVAEELTLDTTRFDCRNITGEELLEASREAIALGRTWTPRSPEQEAFNALEEDGCLTHVDGRLSRFFLDRHAELLD